MIIAQTHIDIQPLNQRSNLSNTSLLSYNYLPRCKLNIKQLFLLVLLLVLAFTFISNHLIISTRTIINNLQHSSVYTLSSINRESHKMGISQLAASCGLGNKSCCLYKIMKHKYPYAQAIIELSLVKTSGNQS